MHQTVQLVVAVVFALVACTTAITNGNNAFAIRSNFLEFGVERNGLLGVNGFTPASGYHPTNNSGGFGLIIDRGRTGNYNQITGDVLMYGPYSQMGIQYPTELLGFGFTTTNVFNRIQGTNVVDQFGRVSITETISNGQVVYRSSSVQGNSSPQIVSGPLAILNPILNIPILTGVVGAVADFTLSLRTNVTKTYTTSSTDVLPFGTRVDLALNIEFAVAQRILSPLTPGVQGLIDTAVAQLVNNLLGIIPTTQFYDVLAFNNDFRFTANPGTLSKRVVQADGLNQVSVRGPVTGFDTAIAFTTFDNDVCVISSFPPTDTAQQDCPPQYTPDYAWQTGAGTGLSFQFGQATRDPQNQNVANFRTRTYFITRDTPIANLLCAWTTQPQSREFECDGRGNRQDIIDWLRDNGNGEFSDLCLAPDFRHTFRTSGFTVQDSTFTNLAIYTIGGGAFAASTPRRLVLTGGAATLGSVTLNAVNVRDSNTVPLVGFKLTTTITYNNVFSINFGTYASNNFAGNGAQEGIRLILDANTNLLSLTCVGSTPAPGIVYTQPLNTLVGTTTVLNLPRNDASIVLNVTTVAGGAVASLQYQNQDVFVAVPMPGCNIAPNWQLGFGATAGPVAEQSLRSYIFDTLSINTLDTPVPVQFTIQAGDGTAVESDGMATLTIRDNLKPTFVQSCPASQSFPVGAGVTSFVYNYPVVTATDQCSGTIMPVLTAGLPPGLFPLGITTTTYTITDAKGLTDSCTFTTTVYQCNNDPFCNRTEIFPQCADCIGCNGDNICQNRESEAYCSDCDCNDDGLCTTNENLGCLNDCTPCNNDGICQDTENPVSCPNDCDVCGTNNICSQRENLLCTTECTPCVVDGICLDTENGVRGCADCTPSCGPGLNGNNNGKCDNNENQNCVNECGPCVNNNVCSFTESRRCPDCQACNTDGFCNNFEQYSCAGQCAPDCPVTTNGICNSNENFRCTTECPGCTFDGICQNSENRNCAPDCGICDNDNICEDFENLECNDCRPCTLADGFCNNVENRNCPTNCGPCNTNGICEDTESRRCPDCTACVADNVCNNFESQNCTNCGPCQTNGLCQNTESLRCAADCRTCVNNNLCESFENLNCPDCQPCNADGFCNNFENRNCAPQCLPCTSDGICQDTENLECNVNSCRPCVNNGICESFENRNCPDCLACNTDGFCSDTESRRCPSQCVACDADDLCDNQENRECPACRLCDNDNICESFENLLCGDCDPCVTNGICEDFENRNCPDCLVCVNNGICQSFENQECQDCGPCSNTTFCSDAENRRCNPDCLACVNNDICENFENRECPDCRVCNNNKICEDFENIGCFDCSGCNNADGVCFNGENRACPNCQLCNNNGVCDAFENEACDDCDPCFFDGICFNSEGKPHQCPDCGDCAAVVDGFCSDEENRLCTADCGICNFNGFCDDFENLECPDCDVCVVNGVCDAFERQPNCTDCSGCVTNGVCAPSENRNCPDCLQCMDDGICFDYESRLVPICPDCGPCIANTTCENSESVSSCPSDCQTCDFDRVCELFENQACPDCRDCINNNLCEDFERAFRCPDCADCSGDAICDDTENSRCTPECVCVDNGLCEPTENANCRDCDLCNNDGFCNNVENPETCADCMCVDDGFCKNNENRNCNDCNLCNNDGFCDATENFECRPADCLDTFCDGDGICEFKERVFYDGVPSNCSDCGPCVNNNICEDFENHACVDCRPRGACNNDGVCNINENQACNDCRPCNELPPNDFCADRESLACTICDTCVNNGICELSENRRCPDCLLCVTNGVCEDFESIECPDCEVCADNQLCEDFENNRCADCPTCVTDGICKDDENRRCPDCLACKATNVVACSDFENRNCPICQACVDNNDCEFFESARCNDCLPQCDNDGLCEDNENLACGDCRLCDFDGICSRLETLRNCTDCNPCDGDNVNCDDDENLLCTPCLRCNNDLICDLEENRECPDCLLCNENDVCETFEKPQTCSDCLPCNNNGICDDFENSRCTGDCVCNIDGLCEPYESRLVSCEDCNGCNTDGFCDNNESFPGCEDCDPCNRNGICEAGENQACSDCCACNGDGTCSACEHAPCVDCEVDCIPNGNCDEREPSYCPECQPTCNRNSVCEPFENSACPDCRCTNDGICSPLERNPLCADCFGCNNNTICEDSENFITCPRDCSECNNDNICEPNENFVTCPDCDPCNKNGVCEDFENSIICSDCCPCNNDGTCNSCENVDCADCDPCNRDGICQFTEPSSCPDCTGCKRNAIDIAPFISNAGASTIDINQGESVSNFDFVFNDQNADGPWNAFFDWDGTGTFSLSAIVGVIGQIRSGASPIFNIPGTYSARFFISDRCGLTSPTSSFSIRVIDIAPVITSGPGSFSVLEGQTVPGVSIPLVRFFDDSADGPFRALVSWFNDNNFVTNGPNSGDSIALSSSPVYPDGPSTFRPVLKVHDVNDVESDPFSFTVNVVNVAPSFVTLPQNVVINEGDASPSISFQFADPAGSLDAPFRAQFDFDGDSIIDQEGSINAVGQATLALARSFPDGPLSRKISLRLVDKDGGASSTVAFGFNVLNVAPAVEAISNVNIAVGENVPAFTARWTDPGALDTFTVSYVVGPFGGSGSGQVAAGGRSFNVPASPAFNTAGTYQGSVSVTDKDGFSSVSVFSIIVSDAAAPPPTVIVGLSDPVLIEDDGLTLPTISVTFPGNSGGITAVVTYGDGSSPFPGIVTYTGPDSAFINFESHVYCSAAPFNVLVTITGSNGKTVTSRATARDAAGRTCTNGIDCCARNLGGPFDATCSSITCSAQSGCAASFQSFGFDCNRQCTTGLRCDGRGFCNGPVRVSVGLACDDENDCTTDDKCTTGFNECVGTTVSCPEDNDRCTEAVCLPEGGCTQIEIPGCRNTTPAPTPGLPAASQIAVPSSFALPSATNVPKPTKDQRIQGSASSLSVSLFALLVALLALFF